MKRILSVVLACALLVGCVMIFASCGVSGTYENDVLGTYEFGTFGKVTHSVGNIQYKSVFSYKVETEDDGDKQLVLVLEKYVYDGDDEDIKELVADLNEEVEEADEEDRTVKYYFAEGEKDGKKYVEIGVNELLAAKYYKK